jgi:hypothetical protein
MMTPGQIWVKRRLEDIIEMVEEAAGDISTDGMTKVMKTKPNT